MPPRTTAKLPGPTEAEFTRQVIALAKLRGWKTAHFRTALMRSGRWATPVQGDGRGFPDLIMVRKPWLLAIELKVGRNTATAEQLAWLEAFGVIAGMYAAVWRPEDWSEIERILRDGP